MNKTIIKAPVGVRYISDWQNFESNIPEGHVILNKKVTNCGATSYYLSNDKPVILCSPRKTLLKNKHEQNINWNNEHPDNPVKPLHLYRDDDNEPETKPDVGKNAGDDMGEIWRFNKNLQKYLSKTPAPKILVTYDSLHHVIDSLGDKAGNYTVVIDEMQQIFQDATFKADVELSFVNILQKIKNVIYLSATVYFEEYLDSMAEFQNLPYIEIEWPDELLERVSLERIEMKSVVSAGCEVIEKYMKGDTHFVEVDGETIYSKEAVLFINSVSDIVSIIRKSQQKYTLNDGNVNVICSVCDENRKKLKKVGLEIGKVLTENEKQRQFTFVTRTCFLGCDFISNSAYTYIFATPYKDSLSLDISLDLPQIMGRQRKRENPFRNQATLFYRTNCDFTDEKAFNNSLITKYNDTKDIISGWNAMNEKQQQLHLAIYEGNIKSEHYRNNFLGLKKDNNTGRIVPVVNNLVALSQKRAFQIQHDNFFSNLTILKAIESTGMVDVKVSSIQSESNLVKEYYERYNTATTFRERMKLYCEFRGKASESDLKERSFASLNIHRYYKTLGAEKIKALEYKESKIREEYNKYGLTIQELVRGEFVMGGVYLVSDVKAKIQDCYNVMGLKSKAKATDLGEYLDYRECSMGRKRAYQIILKPRKQVSLFNRINETTNFTNLDIDEVLDMVKDGTFKDEMELIRKQTDKKAMNELKYGLLKAETFNGTFYSRSSDRLNEYSSFCALDLDGFVSDDELTVKEAELEKVGCVYSIFRSPSGMGLKVIILHDSTHPEMHRNMMVQLMRLYGGDENDSSVSDLARGNFVSWDEDVYVNRNAEP